ncbi:MULTISPECIES: hypothetical protein [unclassified Clostridioides]|uniref:hypothetical protein n=1 Tax=unclassified Clostridioides TaxID=2635829 RepID=UPI001D101BA0|nr:hypothetical protein [Clostridioides sp. ES-S-0145-01]MCC0682245.1 hypothetical protein [Clostridioides sp. ES-S-0005-03]MCC0705526.1 hypothetical protein [Clostridioides sp. ES-S-0190-01]UDN64170.1 hypothetical protein IC758_20080 [Clostridioides sp. ES-W-0016-02]
MFVPSGYVEYTKNIINNFINENGYVPSFSDLNNSDVKQLHQIYGSWNKVLENLGFINKTNNAEDVLKEVEELRDRLGKIPNREELKENNINIKPLLKKYGKWSTVKSKLKTDVVIENPLLEKNKDKNAILLEKVSNIKEIEEIIEKILDLTNNKKCIPTHKQLLKNGIKINKLMRVMGSWEKIKKELNLESIVSKFDEDKIKNIKKEILDIKNENKYKRAPSELLLKKRGVDVNLLKKTYGSLKEAYKKLKIEEYDIEVFNNEIIKLTKNKIKVPSMTRLVFYKIPIKILFSYYGSYENMIDSLNLKAIVEKAKTIKEEKEKIFRDKTMKEIMEVYQILDKTPIIRELKEYGIKTATFFRKFGNWGEIKAKLKLPKRSKYTNTEIKESKRIILEMTQSLGKIPTIQDLKDNGVRINYLINRYGSYSKLLLELGLITEPLKNKYTDAELEESKRIILEMAQALGKKPTIRSLKDSGVHINYLIKKYGSYSKLLLELGLITEPLKKDKVEISII